MANEWLEAVLILQDRDVRRDNILKQLSYIPDEIKKEEKLILAEKAKLEAEINALKQLEVDHRDLEGQVALVEEALIKYKTQQMEVRKNEEYTALEHEITLQKAKIDSIETQDLELLESIDTQRDAVEQLKVKTAHKITTLEAHIRTLTEGEASYKVELSDAEQAVVDAEAGVDPDILSDYKDVKSQVSRPPYVVPMEESKCQGCHLKVSGDVDSSVRKRLPEVHCDSCGRILYYEF